MDQLSNRFIGVFDSGVGGLTVLREALHTLPNESYLYIGDTKNVPYGIKGSEIVRRLAVNVANILLKHSIKVLVVACNTVSAVALPDIQRVAGNIPVIGVIDPTIHHAITLPNSGTIGVIATQTTIDSHVYEKKIRLLTQGKRKVISKVTSLFVPLIEKNPHNLARIRSTIQTSLTDLKNEKTLDTLILGCTHYPMIKDHIAAFFGENVTIIDSSRPTVQTLKDVLTQHNIFSNSKKPTKIFFTAADPTRSIQITRNFLGENIIFERL